MKIGFLYNFIPTVILEANENKNFVFLIYVNPNNKVKDIHYEINRAELILRTLDAYKIEWHVDKDYRMNVELKLLEDTYLNNPGLGILNRIVTYFHEDLNLGMSRKEISKIVFSYYL